ncbi:MAG: hypothetical protein WAP08_07640 [Smithellaceae bacterium]
MNSQQNSARPELVEARPELVEGGVSGNMIFRSWFDRLTTNGQ